MASEVGRFRKKPVEIDAVRWLGGPESAGPVIDWVLAGGGTARWDDQETPEGTLSIVTLEGVMYADPGDWIIRGVKGEFYPCKPDIFEATYEAVARA